MRRRERRWRSILVVTSSISPICLAWATASLVTCSFATRCQPPRVSAARGMKASPACLQSSNGLPEKMHNHTSCTCWTYPHRVFSHEPSNYFCKRTHNCTDCICSTLWHLYSCPWRFPHFVCSSLDFQVLLPFPLSLCTVLCFSQWLLLNTGTNLMFWKISD